MRRRFGQLIRFGITGVANTVVYYLGYRLLLIFLPYMVAHLIAWAISVIFSFFMNSYFTYKVKPTLKKFLAFPATTLVNLAFTTAGSAILVELVNFDERYVTLLMGILAIPFTFIVTTFILDPRESSALSADGRDDTTAN